MDMSCFSEAELGHYFILKQLAHISLEEHDLKSRYMRARYLARYADVIRYLRENSLITSYSGVSNPVLRITKFGRHYYNNLQQRASLNVPRLSPPQTTFTEGTEQDMKNIPFDQFLKDLQFDQFLKDLQSNCTNRIVEQNVKSAVDYLLIKCDEWASANGNMGLKSELRDDNELRTTINSLVLRFFKEPFEKVMYECATTAIAYYGSDNRINIDKLVEASYNTRPTRYNGYYRSDYKCFFEHVVKSLNDNGYQITRKPVAKKEEQQ